MILLNVGVLVVMALGIKASNYEGTVACAGRMEISLDSRLLMSISDGTVPTQVKVPGDSKLVNMYCYNRNGNVAMLASFDNGVVTDSSWRCTSRGIKAFTSLSFDESLAGLATEMGDQGSGGWATIEGTPATAKWIGSSQGGSHSSVAGRVTCVGYLSFFVDDQKILDDSNLADVSVVNVPEDAKQLAYQCTAASGAMGMMASFDNGLTTDGSWRCMNARATNPFWQSYAFDDSDWLPAAEIAAHGSAGFPAIPGAPSSAAWIWDAPLNNHTSVACRKRFHSYTTVHGVLRCDGKYISVYVDGSPVGSSTELHQLQIPDDTKVVAVSCTSPGVPAKIIASFDNGLITDSAWRCGPIKSVYWQYTTFDESQWAPASQISEGTVDGISTAAKWIGDGLGSERVGCRIAWPTVAPTAAPTAAPTTAADVQQDEGEVTPDGCKLRQVVHPAGETWIQETNVDPQRQWKCYCPDPLPATWSLKSGGCTAVCVKEDGIEHFAGDTYERSIDGVLTDCRCNNFGRERCG